MAIPKREKGYQKYAWVLLVLGGLLGLIAFVPPPPGSTRGPYDFVLGPLIGIMGIVQLTIGPTFFRKGKRWGWYLILLAWMVAASNGVYDSIVASPITGVGTFFVFGGPALLALVLTYQKFFHLK